MLSDNFKNMRKNLIDFLDRQKIEYSEEDIDDFLSQFLKNQIVWDKMKYDIYEEVWEYFDI